MTNAFESIAQGLREAIAISEGEAIPANVYRPEEIDVGQLRRSLGTLRHWERGDGKPHGPALALLHVVTKERRSG